MSENGAPNQNSGCSESYSEYLKRAIEACEEGDLVLGMHLYLAAYEKSVVDPTIPDGMALSGLREAWRLACDLKERSMAEYVFEKLEPYLTGEEIAECAQQLQNLALDRLEQYGFSREELEDMAEMISQDFMSGDGSVVKVESISIPNMGMFGVPAVSASNVQSAHEVQEPEEQPEDQKVLEVAAEVVAAAAAAVQDEASIPVQDVRGEESHPDQAGEDEPKKKGEPHHVGMGTAPVSDFNPYSYYEDYSIGKSYHAATNEGMGAYVFSRDEARLEAGRKFKEEETSKVSSDSAEKQLEETGADQGQTVKADASDSGTETKDAVAERGQEARTQAQRVAGTAVAADAAEAESKSMVKRSTDTPVKAQATAQDAIAVPPGALNYDSLVGYDEAVSIMRDYGVGLQHDRGFLDFVEMMNQKHGIDQAPALDTMLFRAPVIEDAARFVDATIGEIGLPVLRVSMEEGMQGAPVLCVTTDGNRRPRMNHARNRFEAPAILVIEDLDTWIVPQVPENVEGMNGFVMANISRGAREAMNFIRYAVEDPDVFVLATASTSGGVDPFFYEMLEPLTVIDIGYPNDKERSDIWTEIARDHPSMRMINRADLMRYSEGLARYDIYMAAREALEEAYKIGLVQRGYVPVSAQNIFEKLAACQPLDSDAYRALEDEVIRRFQDDLDHIEDFVNGTWE